MPESTMLAEAINLSDLAAHPTEALAALIAVVRRQEEIIIEHEMRLDRHSDYLYEVRHGAPKSGTIHEDRREILRSLLKNNGCKMPAKEARQKMNLDKSTFSRLLDQMDDIEVQPMKTDRRRSLLILRSKKG